MSKPYTEADLSFQLDSELTWRRKELSDLKLAIRIADAVSRNVLLRSLVTMAYAHWEGYVRTCANKYFVHITLKRLHFREMDFQYYKNSFLMRLDALFGSKAGIKEKCELIASISGSQDLRFAYIHPDLVDTKSNLNTDVIIDLCRISGFDGAFFEENRFFIDSTLLKKRNAIAHGQSDGMDIRDVDEFISKTLSLIGHFKALIENKVYLKAYLRSP